MVQEPLGDVGGFWLPTGRVEHREKLTDGRVRETCVRNCKVHSCFFQSFSDSAIC